MDDFEKAVLFTFDQSGAVGPELRAQAEQYCSQAKAQPPQVLWRACVERVTLTQYAEVQFWCLQALEELVRQSPLGSPHNGSPEQLQALTPLPNGNPHAGRGYGALPSTEKAALCSSLLALMFSSEQQQQQLANGDVPGNPAALAAPRAWSWPPFVRNKLCQVVALLISRDYPHPWDTPLLAMVAGFKQGPSGVDMACRALLALDEQVISVEFVRTPEESAAAGRVKDAMRLQCVPQLVEAWLSVVLTFVAHPMVGPTLGVNPGSIQEGLNGAAAGFPGGFFEGAKGLAARALAAAEALQTMQLYISWIDIQLVANDTWTPVINSLIASRPGETISVEDSCNWNRVRGAAADCMQAIVAKRMEADAKIMLLSRMGICNTVVSPGVLLELAPSLAGDSTGGGAGAPESNSGASGSLGALITRLTEEIFECIRKLEASEDPSKATGPAMAAAKEMLGTVLPAVFLLAERAHDEEVSASAFQILLVYANWLKKLVQPAVKGEGSLKGSLKGGKKKGGGASGSKKWVKGDEVGPPVQAASEQLPAALPPQQQEHVQRMLAVILSRMRFNEGSAEALDAPTKAGEEEEESMNEFRKDLFVLLRSLARVDPDTTCAFVLSALSAALSSQAPTSQFRDVEAALQLFYQLGEGFTEEQHSALLNADPSTSSTFGKGNGSAAHAANGNGVVAVNGAVHGERSRLATASDIVARCLLLVLGTPVGSFPHCSHRLVCLALLDIAVRYVRFVQHWSQLIPGTMALFLGPCGVGHPSQAVSSRASYLLMRLVKVVRQQLVPVLESVLQGLERPLMAISTASTSRSQASVGKLDLTFDDRVYAFEAAGLLLGQEAVPEEQQTKFLSVIVLPLITQMESIAAASTAPQQARPLPPSGALDPGASWALQQILLALSYLSKGFSSRMATETRPAIGAIFKQALQSVLKTVHSLPPDRALRSKVISFVHRMLDMLGKTVFSALPQLLQELMSSAQAKELTEILLLLSQLVSKFGVAAAPLLEEMLLPLSSRLFELLPADKGALMAAPAAAAVGNIEELREQRDLLRAFVSFVHALTTSASSTTAGAAGASSASSSSAQAMPSTAAQLTLVDVLSSPRNASSCLQQITNLLLNTAACHHDMSLRKYCFSVFVRLVTEWCSPDSEKVTGFRSFVLDRLVPQGCFVPCLHPSFNFKDVNTLLLFNETALTLVTSWRCLGAVPLTERVQAVILPQLLCPGPMAAEFSARLQTGDVRVVRDSLQALAEQLRRNPALEQQVVSLLAGPCTEGMR